MKGITKEIFSWSKKRGFILHTHYECNSCNSIVFIGIYKTYFCTTFATLCNSSVFINVYRDFDFDIY